MMAGKYVRLGLFGSLLMLTVQLPGVSVASSTFISITTPEDMRRYTRETEKEKRADSRFCHQIFKQRKALTTLLTNPEAAFEQLGRVASYIWDGENGCRKDKALAIEIMEHVVGKDPLTTDNNDALIKLETFHNQIGTPASSDRAQYLQKLIWVRNYGYKETPVNWNAEERRAFIASEPIWAYITKNSSLNTGGRQSVLYSEAILDPLSPRYDPKTYIDLAESDQYGRHETAVLKLLLDGVIMPQDEARAEALLFKRAPNDDMVRSLILPLFLKRLDSEDPAIRNAAVEQLMPLTFGYNTEGPGSDAIRARLAPIIAKRLFDVIPEVQTKAGQSLTDFAVKGCKEAEEFLIPWLERSLIRGTDEQKQASWAALSRLSTLGKPHIQKLIDDDVLRNNGIADGGQLTIENGNLKNIITPNDYPPRSVRSGEHGIVEASVIIAPNGRVMSGFITRSAHEQLDAAVLKNVKRRIKHVFPAFPGRYVKAKLPPIHFKLTGCDFDDNQTETPAGALVVEGVCRRPDISI
jgi:hypothetical protein